MLKSIAVSLALASGLLAQDCANLGTSYGTGDDVIVNAGAAIPIGFAFPFAGGSYTDVHPCTNGFFYLSNAGVPAPGAGDGTATSAELASGSPRICALWTDLNITAANNGGVYVASSPTECVITWRNAQNFGIDTNVFTIQAVLRTGGDIEFRYQYGATNNSTFSAAYAAGLVGVSPGGGVTLPAASNLLAGGATANNTVFEDFLVANTFDLGGNSLLLVPNNPGWAFVPTGGGVNTCATNRTYGSGCGTGNPVGEARYELFTAATPFDLSNTGHSYLWTGNGYVLTDIATPVVPAIGTPTTFTDDNTQQIALGFPMPTPAGLTSDIWLCSNGWLSFEATTSTDLSEAVADHLNGTAKLAFLWDDLNPATGGTITIDQLGGQCVITFDGVPEFSNTGANTVQVVLSASGDIEVRYGACSLADALVGISPGSTANDGGSLDYSALSTGGPIVVGTGMGPFGAVIMALDAVNRPELGTTWSLTTSGVDALSPITITYVGSNPLDPGIDLGFLGAPGCNAHIGSILGNLTGIVSAGSSTVSLPIPVNPVFAGVIIDAQSICLTLANPLNLLTSNGLEGVIGF